MFWLGHHNETFTTNAAVPFPLPQMLMNAAWELTPVGVRVLLQQMQAVQHYAQTLTAPSSVAAMVALSLTRMGSLASVGDIESKKTTA